VHKLTQTTTVSTGEQELSVPAAGRLPLGWRWIDFVSPAQQEALVYDRLVQSRIDDHILKLIRSGDSVAAKAMYGICLGFVAAQSDLRPRVFWQICAAYFEAVSVGLVPADADAKRALAAILLQYRTLARGETSVSERLLRELLLLLAQVDPLRAPEVPLLTELRRTYGLTGTPSQDGEKPDMGRLDSVRQDQVKVIGSLRIGISDFNAYLNEADEWSRRLFVELSEWTLELHRPVPGTTLELAHSLAESSAGVGLLALSEMADALEQALRHVQAQTRGMPQHASVFLRAAEDIRRLLHQFAAGFLKQPEPTLLQALREIGQFEFPAVGGDEGATAGRLSPIFVEKALASVQQLGGALRQWQARPQNIGARDESLRILQILLSSARLAGATDFYELSSRLRASIEQLGSQLLQPAQLEPLSVGLDALKAHLDQARAVSA
jgi:HPt (histidine-containing phosphotransfer) domain-containing protein